MAQLVIPAPAGAVTSVNTQTGAVLLSTNNIPEGGSGGPLYFTTARVAAAITVSNTAGNVYRGTTYNNSTGVLTISADYLAATPYTFVLRDSTGSIIAYNGNFTETTVQDVLSVLNAIYTPTLNVQTLNVQNSMNIAGTLTVPNLNVGTITTSSYAVNINAISASDFRPNQLYINSNLPLYVSTVLSISSQSSTLPYAGLRIDPAGGINFTTNIGVFGFQSTVGPSALSTIQLQVGGWIPTNASFMFSLINTSLSTTNIVNVVAGTSQTVVF